MHIINTKDRYGFVSILMHWVMAILMVGIVVAALYMTRIPIGALKLKLFRWHKEFGMLILMLVMLRVVWRFGNINPDLPESVPGWQKKAARLVHWLFYGLMLALPVSGWLITSAAGLPVSFFGWFVFPNIVSPDEDMRYLYTKIHEWLAYGLIAVFCLHVAAALKHHFIDKDDILRRMFS